MYEWKPLREYYKTDDYKFGPDAARPFLIKCIDSFTWGEGEVDKEYWVEFKKDYVYVYYLNKTRNHIGMDFTIDGSNDYTDYFVYGCCSVHDPYGSTTLTII